ncbi:alpha/beta fold hydrolase [Segnochrobactrum spirostomi]|uniref:Alpha/beta fold hydrolase n=1 Tax=Segnochrobactrum spirostomi TaxID=2608987 RepID=A0A6A7Y7Q8_9HYPH|nr:alpha/beta fold hydrolase [Segnochrobactrum spirostomi]MQT15400.1 alpha/beta fold hydrolase [Segnochrobactrum spirostomi]
MPLYRASDGCGIHYERVGTDGPAVLLIPGLGGDGRFWADVTARLVPDHRLLIVDHRGAGRSDRPPGRYSLAQIAGDIVGLMAEVGEPMHVVGHSTGGAIAQIIALDHPTWGLDFIISSAWARADARFRMLFTARAELLDAGLAAPYQRLTHVLGHEPAYLAAHTLQLEAAIAAAEERLAPLSVASARVRMLLYHDRLAELSRIKAPVLVVAADGDILVPPALSRAIADAIPGAIMRMVSGAHFHPVADPRTFAGLVRRFVGDAKGEEIGG